MVRVILVILFLATLGLNVYRAYTQSLTVDEAFSYLSFIAPNRAEAFAHYDANNHVLNTWLGRAAVRRFGPSEIVLRLPSLLGGALYLFVVLRLSEWMFGAGLQAILSFIALSANPILLEYLSAARGYSLGLGFEFLAIWLIAWSLSVEPTTNRRWRNIAAGVSLALSGAGNLVFVIPNLVLIAAFVFLAARTFPKPNWRRVGKSFVEIAAPGLAVFAMLMYWPLAHASASNFYIGEQSFQRSAEILLVRSFNHPVVYWGHRFSGPLRWMAAPAILLALLLLSLIAVKGRSFSPTKLWPAPLIAPLTLVGSLAALVTLHLLIGFPYPYERTGLYFIPLATLTILEAAGVGLRLPALRIPAILLYFYLCFAAVEYLLELRVDRYKEWASDAGTKRVVTLLAEMNKPATGPKRLAVSWGFEYSVNYYRKILGLDWLAPVDRTDPLSRSFDYYYLKPDDRSIVDTLKLSVLYTDPVSEAVLAAPTQR